MSLTHPSFAYSADLVAQAQATHSWLEVLRRRERRSKHGWRALALGLLMLSTVLAAALLYAVPAIRLVPVLLWVSDDGVTHSSVTPETMSPVLADRAKKAVLWNYVLSREAYSWQEADRSNYIVQAMSDVAVKQQYLDYMSPKNKGNYLNTLGHNCTVRIELSDITEFHEALPERPGKYTVHFLRALRCNDGALRPTETWTATVEFLTEYSGTWIKVQDILQFNPFRMVVTAYPGALKLPGEIRS